MNDVYAPESPDHISMRDSIAWQAGDLLPISSQHSSQNKVSTLVASSPGQLSSISQIQSMLQSMQRSIESNLKDVKERLTEVEARMTGVEEKQKEVVNNVGTPSSSSKSATEFGRKRRSPPELQVKPFPLSVHFKMCVLVSIHFLSPSMRSEKCTGL